MERRELAPQNALPPLAPLLENFQVNTPGEVRWAHRVNTLLELQEAKKRNVHFIEGDVRGKTPVMHHNPLETGKQYLSQKNYLEEVLDLDQGIKLDHKEPDAVGGSLSNLKELSFPVPRLILHVNVFKGPDGRKPIFQPELFARQCRAFSSDILISLGFTTLPGCPPFTQEMIEEAAKFASSVQPATVCLRVELVTPAIMESLINKGIPVTLWSDQDFPLGEIWWKEHEETIRQWKPFAFMDFPDFSLPQSSSRG